MPGIVAIRRRAFLASIAASALIGARDPDKEPFAPGLRDFTKLFDGIDGAEGIATSPSGHIAFSTRAAAVGLFGPGGNIDLLGRPLATGGVAYTPDGRILVANVGALHGLPGPLRRIDPASGKTETLVAELEGRTLVASNSPVAARDGTIYCSHSGWTIGNVGTTSAEGFIYAVDRSGQARIVARGLRGVNGLCLGRGDRRLYAALTAEGRVVSWRRRRDGGLEDKRYFGPVLGTVVADQTAAQVRALPREAKDQTGYCDGLAFDTFGNLWITLPFANKIVAIMLDGEVKTMVHDPLGEKIAFPTNLAWGDPDLCTLHVVSRDTGAIVTARTRPGMPMANWPISGRT